MLFSIDDLQTAVGLNLELGVAVFYQGFECA